MLELWERIIFAVTDTSRTMGDSDVGPANFALKMFLLRIENLS